MKALADHLVAVADEDSADERIGADLATAEVRELERSAKVGTIGVGGDESHRFSA